MERAKVEYTTASERIDQALTSLRLELTWIRQQDVELLKQLMHISNTIRLMRRQHAFRNSKSLSLSAHGFAQSTTLDNLRRPPLVRQCSVPQSLALDRRHTLALNLSISSTEDSLGSPDDYDYTDSLGSPDDQDLFSSNEFQETTFSNCLRRPNLYHPRNRPMSLPYTPSLSIAPPACLSPTPSMSIAHPACLSPTPSMSIAHPACLPLANSNEVVVTPVKGDDVTSYEEILRRNVKLWKLSASNHSMPFQGEMTYII